MDELIKRSDAIKLLESLPSADYYHSNTIYTDMAIDAIESMPSADRPQGEWIIHKINGIPHTAECSCCHNHYDYEDLRRIGGVKKNIALPYCPNCGADMRKGADDEYIFR